MLGTWPPPDDRSGDSAGRMASDSGSRIPFAVVVQTDDNAILVGSNADRSTTCVREGAVSKWPLDELLPVSCLFVYCDLIKDFPHG
jgi:hypothetical protein